jgi:hypothetical protein
MRWPVIGMVCGAAVGLGLAVWSETIGRTGWKITPGLSVHYLTYLAAVLGAWIGIGAFLGLALGSATVLLLELTGHVVNCDPSNQDGE